MKLQRVFLTVALLIANGSVGRCQHEELASNNAQWQTFPSIVRNVKFDHHGKTWFELNGTASVAEIKSRVEAAVHEETPHVIGAVILMIDSKGRVWLRPQRDNLLLMGFDPSAKSWTERRAQGEIGAHHFTDPAYESAAGVLYFSARRGVHVLKGDAWSYRDLYQANFDENLFYGDIKSFNPPQFEEDDAGNVFVWSGWGRYGWTGTIGYFQHDGDAWKQIRTVGDAKLTQIESVAPLADGRVLICPSAEAAFIARPAEAAPKLSPEILKDIELLANASFQVREDAQSRLQKRGAAIREYVAKALQTATDAEQKYRLQALMENFREQVAGPRIDGHVFFGGRVNLMEADGTVWLYVNRTINPNGVMTHGAHWRISKAGTVRPAPEGTKDWYPDDVFVDARGRVYFARYEKGCVMFDDEKLIPITDHTQQHFRYIRGEDKDGRIYLGTDNTVMAYDARRPDLRAPLAVTMYETPRSEQHVARDSFGRVWAKLSGDEHPWLSVFDDGGWVHHTLPDGAKAENIAYLQPLKDGWMIASPGAVGVTYLYNGEEWRQFASLLDLVKDHYADLRDRVDNHQWGRDFYVKLRVDAQKRIWVTQWTNCKVYDGTEWRDVGAAVNDLPGRFGNFSHCLPFPDGAGMIVGNSGLDYGAVYLATIAKDSVELKRIPAPDFRSLTSDYTTRSGLWIDSTNRLLLPSGREDHVSFTFEEGKFIKQPATGSPRFEDSQGDLWYLQRHTKKLVVRPRKGEPIAFADDGVHGTTHIAEAAPGHFFIGTNRGILHVVKETNEGKTAINKVKLYDRGAPTGDCLDMFIGADKHLWFYGPGPSNYRLWRMEIPITVTAATTKH